MEKNIQHILQELYAIDPGLKKHEIEIAQVIEAMTRQKPDTKYDENFAKELRMRVLEKFSTQHAVAKKETYSWFRSPWVHTLGGAIATLAIAVPVVYFSSPLSGGVIENSFSGGTRIARAEANAFGPLQPVSVNTQHEGRGGDAQTMEFGGGVEKMSSLLYEPVYTNYNFSFESTIPSLSETVEVLKRESNNDAGSQYAGVLQRIKMGLFDLGKVNNAYVQSFTLAEDRDRGYVVTVDMVGGYVSIFENYSKWPVRTFQQPTISDVLEDEELISIADSFLAEYGIDMRAHAPGTVDSRWRVGYETATDKSLFYIPNVQTVVYQLVINGKPVYEEYGEPMGIRVNVHSQEKRVTSVDGIMTKTFSASSYVGETDENRLRAILSKGRMPVYAEPTKTVDVVLENVSEGYMRRWQFDEATGTSNEIFVPALIARVQDFESVQKEGLWQETVVIPLAREMLAELEKQSEEPITIMPYEPMSEEAEYMKEPAIEPRG